MADNVSAFLEIAEIPGESDKQNHETHIEVSNVTWNLTAPYDSTSGSRTGGVNAGPILIMKNIDKSSPYLAQACFTNKPLPEVKFYCARYIKDEVKDYFIITLTDAAVIDYNLSGGNGGIINDSAAFSYKEIKLTYEDEQDITMNIAKNST